jgi:large subunit ribosomal protein L29
VVNKLKASKFFDMTDDQLRTQEKELKAELFNLRFQLATGQLSNPMALKNTKRDIARVKTILRQREMQAQA